MLRQRYIRLFVSSTFEDMKIERNILQKKVFPKISTLCLSKGWIFEDVDLRWGISPDASRKQKTMQICIEEIKKCQQYSPKPNFIILMGDRLGWEPLPEVIQYADSKDILSIAQKNELELFHQWYRLDENAIGGEYVLQPRNGKYQDYNVYEKEVETPMKELFKRYACHLSNCEKKILYSGSATMQEIYYGALSVPDADDHVVVYSRTLTEIPAEQIHQYTDEHGKTFMIPDKNGKQIDIRKSIAQSSSKVIKKEITYDQMLSQEYAIEFEESIYKYLEQIVLNEIESNQNTDQIEYDRERSIDFISTRNAFFIGRGNDLSSIISALHDNDSRPFFITGPSGAGKSSLISKVIESCSANFNVLSRFIGHTFSRSSGIDLLYSIWKEMDMYGSFNKEFSILNFSERVQKSSFKKPMLIVIDGIDQLPFNDELLMMHWLPKHIEGNVRILCSILDRAEYHHILKWCNVRVYALAPLSHTEAESFIDLKLNTLGRTLTQAQHKAVMDAVNNSDMLPIYLNTVTYLASLLHSYEEELNIPSDIKELICIFFDNIAMTENHGEALVKKVLSYLVSVRYGISHNDLRDILASDNEYWQSLLESSVHEMEFQKVPSAIIIRLLSDLNWFINQQPVFDGVLIFLNHRIVAEAIIIWLKKHSTGMAYEELFGFYNDQWQQNNQHAIYEVSHLALMSGFHNAYKLYTDLDYTISKIINSASDVLRPDIYIAQTRIMMQNMDRQNQDALRKDLDIFRTFDAEANAYAKTLIAPCSASSVRNGILGLAANWAKGSIVRCSFERSRYGYSSLLNTLGTKNYDNHLLVSLPQMVDLNAVISNDGDYIIWNNCGKLYKYSTYDNKSRHIIPEYHIDDFKVSDDFSIIAIKAGNKILIYDTYGYRIRNSYILPVPTVLGLSMHIKKSDNTHIVVFHDNENLYKIWSDTNGDSWIGSYPIGNKKRLEIAGFLKDGDWIVLMEDGDICEDDTKKIYRYVIAYEFSDTLKSKGGCKHKIDSKYRFISASTSGQNLLLSSASNEITICDYSGENMQIRNIPLFNNWGRIPTYGIHVSSDEKDFWSISGDMKMILYNLRDNCKKYVINMPDESSVFKASANNKYLLISMHDHTHKQYDSIMRTDRFTDSDDYYPTMLSTISSDSRGRLIFTSHGWDFQTHTEGATMFNIGPEGMHRYEYHDPNTLKPYFATSTAVSKDAKRFIYAKGIIVEHVGSKTNHYSMDSKDLESRTKKFHISRLEYTPDNSAFLALPGNSMYFPTEFGFLFTTADEEVGGKMKYRLEMPVRDGNNYHSTISNNGAYALIWFHSSLQNKQGGTVVDLRNNKILFQHDGIINMRFFPDSKATIMSFSIDSTKSKKISLLNELESRVGIIESITPKGTTRLLQLRYKNTMLGDIAPNGQYAALIDYSLSSGTRVILTLNKKEMYFNEIVHACRITYDSKHIFVICRTCIYLVSTESMDIIQKFQMNYPKDYWKRNHSSLFMGYPVDNRMVNGKVELMHKDNNILLYDKGLLISDWSQIFRIEPHNYRINDVSFTTISRVWNHKKNEYDSPKASCPMCGNRFTPPNEVLECIEEICKDMPYDSSPCMNLSISAWDTDILQGHCCPHCGNKLRFNPFIG